MVLLVMIARVSGEELRALWIPSWDMTTRGHLEKILKQAAENDFNTVILEVRFRCDSFYIPNRKNDEYPNPDSASRLLQEDFDALEFAIDKSEELELKVYAWLTAFVATSNDLDKCNFNNPWFRASNLITRDVNWEKMPPTEKEGAFLEPGLPQVQKYIHDVVMDVAMNYDIDGIQLDYIRYPGQGWGYHPEAFARYQDEVYKQSPAHWQKWRNRQVTNTVKSISTSLKKRNPHIELTAAVISDPERAILEYNQDWLLWLRKGYVKRVFPMNYHVNQELYEDAVDKIASHGYEYQTVMGIRAWDHPSGYYAEDINEKINYSWEKGIFSYALFSSTGINAGKYWSKLIIRKSR